MDPRQQILSGNREQLREDELLALVLRTGSNAAALTNERRANSLSRALMLRFGGWERVVSATAGELKEISGVGPAKAASLMAVGELVRRRERPPLRRQPVFHSAQQIYEAVEPLAHEEQEVVVVLYLDAGSRLIHRREVFRGTVDSVQASPREILRYALLHNASRMVVVHNHPSQSAEPSAQDVHFTERLCQASVMMGIELLDHLIVCRGGVYYSFASQFWQERKRSESTFQG